jgi:hypothetical protein
MRAVKQLARLPLTQDPGFESRRPNIWISNCPAFSNATEAISCFASHEAKKDCTENEKTSRTPFAAYLRTLYATFTHFRFKSELPNGSGFCLRSNHGGKRSPYYWQLFCSRAGQSFNFS